MRQYIAIAVSLTVLAACAAGRSSVAQDTLLADQGYQEIIKGNYERAEANLKVALSINPKNPYALLNMGVLYQNTGRIEDARQMYQKLIALNPDAVAVKSTTNKHGGKRLVDIARQNLSALGSSEQ